MSDSKLLKEAIADARAVRETAIANAKIALEEAFTPQLQNMLSKKLQAEMEDYDDDVVAEDGIPGVGFDDPTNADDATIDEYDDDDLDLDEIIKEMESDMDFGDDMYESDMDFDLDEDMDFDGLDEYDEFDDDMYENDMDFDLDEDMDFDDDMYENDMDFDLDEDMDFDEFDDDLYEYDEIDDYDEPFDENVRGRNTFNNSGYLAVESKLNRAYDTIRSMKNTMNEVNLLNAKLLYANKLFRDYELTNSQKAKVVESLDKTSSVKEVKLVYSTLMESVKFNATKKRRSNISENVVSKPIKTTAPRKSIISENTDDLATRFKQLAGIIK